VSKVQDYDLAKQDVNVQDTHDDIKNILNLGNYEIKKITSAYPSWTEIVDGIPVLGVYGAQRTLFISDTGSANGWSYVLLSEL